MSKCVSDGGVEELMVLGRKGTPSSCKGLADKECQAIAIARVHLLLQSPFMH